MINPHQQPPQRARYARSFLSTRQCINTAFGPLYMPRITYVGTFKAIGMAQEVRTEESPSFQERKDA